MTGGGAATGGGWDFFVSYTQGDRAWAEWVAWQLEAAGFTVVIQAWDMQPGDNWVHRVDEAVRTAAHTVAVLSPDYLASVWGRVEQLAALRADPLGERRALVPVRVADCDRPGLLSQVVSVDLFGVGEVAARARLVGAAKLAASGGRGKPGLRPPFPPAGRVVPEQPRFPADLPAVWNAPPRLAHFVGREELLDVLHAQLSASGAVAVTGLGGVGKTAVALEYAHRHAGEFDVVWWVPAEQPELVAGHVAALGMELGLAEGAAWVAVRAVLHRERLRWLLVLDNVDDPGVVGPFRPSDGRGRLLVTSRLTGLGGVGAAVQVAELARAEAVSLLTRRVTGIDPTAAARVAGLLGDLPLAVEQAAGYLTQTGIPPDEYAGLLEGRLGQMLDRGWVADRPGVTVARLWELSVARLRVECPAAVVLLELCAVCAAEAVPLDLLTGGASELAGGPLRDAVADPVAWAEAVGALVGFSLARRDGTALSVHRLVAAATRAGMADTAQAERTATVARLLRAALPADIVGTPVSWPRWRSLLAHVAAVLAGGDQPGAPAGEDAAWLCDRAGVYLDHHGQPAAAIPYLHRALTLRQAILGSDHPHTLTTWNDLAYAHASAGRLGEAIELYDQTLADRLRVLGPDHPDTLTSRNGLAGAYETAGRLGEAIPLYDQTLADRLRVLGPDHPDTLASRNNLAGAYQTAGRLGEAIELYDQTLADRLRVLGSDHPDTLASRNDLAYAYETAGRLGEAIELYDQTLADSLRVLGPDHPDTLASRNNLAYAYETAGRLGEAIELYDQTLADSLRVLGPDHPDTLTSRNNLAYAYQTAGRLDQAIELYEQTLADRLRVLGPDHPDTLTSRNNLAVAYQATGRLGEAIPLFEQTLTDRVRVLGPDHPSTLTSRNNLAGAYQAAGQLNQAIELYEQTLTDRLRILDPDHPSTLGSRNNLAGAYQAAGRLGEAIPLFEQTLTDRLRVLGPDHPDTLTSRNGLAGAYQAAGRLGEAIELFEQTVTDRLRVLGPDHPDTLTSRNGLAGAYQATGRLGEAIELYEQTLADVLRVLGPDHPLVATVRGNLTATTNNAKRRGFIGKLLGR